MTGLPKKFLPPSPSPPLQSKKYIFSAGEKVTNAIARGSEKIPEHLQHSMTIKRNRHRAMSNSTKTVSLPSAVFGRKRIGPQSYSIHSPSSSSDFPIWDGRSVGRRRDHGPGRKGGDPIIRRSLSIVRAVIQHCQYYYNTMPIEKRAM